MKSQDTSDQRIGSPSTRLQRALSSLAISPGDKPVASNAFPVHAENLVVEFDEAYTGFVEGMDQLPSESQLLALQAVDTKLAAMVRMKDASLWTADAFCDDPRWNEVRALAEAAIGEYE
jgi:hypothetical protein